MSERLPATRPVDELGILEERARVLARPFVEDTGLADQEELLVFAVRGERFGVEAARVQGVLPPVTPTPLPGVRPLHVGVVNHRGEVLAVLDLRGLLPSSTRGPRPSAFHMIVVETAGMTFGLLADEIFGFVTTKAGAPRPVPAGGAGSAAWVRGVTGEMVSVVDLEALARDPRVTLEEQGG